MLETVIFVVFHPLRQALGASRPVSICSEKPTCFGAQRTSPIYHSRYRPAVRPVFFFPLFSADIPHPPRRQLLYERGYLLLDGSM